MLFNNGAVLLLLVRMCVALSSPWARSSTTPPTTAQPYNKLMDYLDRYGYNSQGGPGGVRVSPLRFQQSATRGRAIRAFQRFNGLPVTGQLDAATSRLIATPRCSNPDMADDNGLVRATDRRRGKWHKNRLTYSFDSTTQDLSVSKQKSVTRKAFQLWSDVTPLDFEETNGMGDIKIKFASRYHGDGVPFDGPGKILAHAFYPNYGGDAHFDDDERFTDGGRNRGIDYYQVAAHEFGHSLGLIHSTHPKALMAPYYRGYTANLALHQDDIGNIQSIYGKRGSPPGGGPTAPPTKGETQPPRTRGTTHPKGSTPDWYPSTRTPMHALCLDPRFDAIVTHRLFRTIIFKGPTLFTSDGVSYKISDLFSGFSSVDAAFAMDFRLSWKTTSSPLLFLFHGTHKAIYKVVEGRRGVTYTLEYDSANLQEHLSRGRPVILPDVISNIDSIFRWSLNGRVYATKGNQYYRLTNDLQGVSRRYPPYPRPLSVWNLPNTVSKVDAVEGARGYTRFFTGTVYYLYDNRNNMSGARSTRSILRCGAH